MIDLLIVSAYFIIVFVTALTGRTSKEATTEEYFLSGRNLRWHSIAFSTIATNVQGYQFLGFMGSAYLYGLAQANFEINAIQGLLLAAFIFVPMYLREKIITITQFIKTRLGSTVALLYSASNILLFSTITLGAALFWGAYSVDLVFGDFLSFIHQDRLIRITILIVFLGLFSATYTYFGGLAAVVRTDVIQFGILLTGGVVVLFIAIYHMGGWSQLYEKTGDLMHLHLPADHDTLPWTHIFGAFLLNINYWCANQSVVQRSLAAKSLKDVQIGLMVGGLMKYFMAAIIILPGIALVGILGKNGLPEPDAAFPYLVNTYLPIGIKGLVLCALFASLMSTVDSTFNSLATLWSIDIYKVYVNKKATDQQVVRSGKRAILLAFISGSIIGIVLLYLKFQDPGAAFTHTLNQLRYFINCGIVVLISAAAFLAFPKHRVALFGFAATVPLQFFFLEYFPDMNYFVRAMWVIIIGFVIIWLGSRTGFIKDKLKPEPASPMLAKAGIGMALSLVLLHIIFH